MIAFITVRLWLLLLFVPLSQEPTSDHENDGKGRQHHNLVSVCFIQRDAQRAYEQNSRSVRDVIMLNKEAHGARAPRILRQRVIDKIAVDLGCGLDIMAPSYARVEC